MGDDMSPMSTGPAELGSAMSDGIVYAPGCIDALSAKLAERHGFRAMYLSGAVVSACSLGVRDIGHVGRSDMLTAARALTGATSLPLIADADTGYGDVHQVRRTVMDYERAGVAALHIEDQVNPKRCGSMAGKELVTSADATRRIASAVSARHDVLVIARTDAWSVEGPAAAIERARQYAEAGADMLFISGATSLEDLESVRAGVRSDIPLLLNMSEAAGVLTPIPEPLLRRLGVAIVIFPVAALLACAAAVDRVFGALRSSGSADPVDRWSWPQLEDLLGATSDGLFESHVFGSPEDLVAKGTS